MMTRQSGILDSSSLEPNKSETKYLISSKASRQVKLCITNRNQNVPTVPDHLETSVRGGEDIPSFFLYRHAGVRLCMQDKTGRLTDQPRLSAVLGVSLYHSEIYRVLCVHRNWRGSWPCSWQPGKEIPG